MERSATHFVQVPVGRTRGTPFSVGSSTFVAGSAGRNILIGPRLINFDMSVFKDFRVGERVTLEFRVEAYDLLNKTNPAAPLGNVYSVGPQDVPALAFGQEIPSSTPARVSGLIPEYSLDPFRPP